ncbi:hypothetical protein QR680_013071 [Steinernema hermaphroditum]|uniref:G-protein coupled receptors family 1 profile domain-containing protein n=1 Tax=Steinernema hermaphroditum TaxID=289476 RepID=A0AA39M1N1_9BILA|nr:hypothetical protein QR680_013071 [Steinernema hermaphroditum]
MVRSALRCSEAKNRGLGSSPSRTTVSPSREEFSVVTKSTSLIPPEDFGDEHVYSNDLRLLRQTSFLSVPKEQNTLLSLHLLDLSPQSPRGTPWKLNLFFLFVKNAFFLYDSCPFRRHTVSTQCASAMAMCENDRALFNMSDPATLLFLDQLEQFSRSYTVIHRYFCALICLCGVALNLIHIVVLTRRQMRIYAVNSILAIMASCDVVTMISYLIYLIRFKFIENEQNVFGYNYYWLLFLLVHVVLSIALHTVSLYLSVVMAFIRVTALEKLDSKWVKSRSVGHIFFATGSVVAVLSIPTLLVHRIEKLDPSFFQWTNATALGAPPVSLYTIGLDPLATEHTCFVFKFNLWLTGICFKVIPCFLLFWFTAALMQKLYETSKKRRMLLGLCDEKRRRKKLAVDKTTYMLIILLTTFLATELPQGALALLNALYTNDVHTYIYLNLGELLDLLSLINCNTSFVLYVIASSRYRLTFRRIFLSSMPMNPSTTAFSILRQLA